MPYKVVRRDHKYYVENQDTGELRPTMGYETEGDAESYAHALYANVEDAGKDHGYDDNTEHQRRTEANAEDSKNEFGGNAQATRPEDDIKNATVPATENGRDVPIAEDKEHRSDRLVSGAGMAGKSDKVNDQDADDMPKKDENPAPTPEDDMADKDAGSHFAYPDENKLPMPDAAHVLLAAEALGPNPPHGRRAQIPSEHQGRVKAAVRARAHELGMSSEDIAKVNAYLEGHMPPSHLKAAEKSLWEKTYHIIFSETADADKAYLASRGAVSRFRVVGMKMNGDTPVIAGWAMLFTDADQKDLTGTYFDDMTKTLTEYYPQAPLFYEHGQDASYKARPIGKRSSLKVYPHGLWMEHDLHPDDPQFSRTVGEIERGELAYSTDSIPQYVRTGYKPSDGRLGVWPVAACALTKKPAEPGLGPVGFVELQKTFKSIADGGTLEADNSEQVQDGPEQAVDGAKAMLARTESQTRQPEITMHRETHLHNMAKAYGCEPTPEAVRKALDTHISEMKAYGHVDPALKEAMGMPDSATPEDAEKALDSMYSAAMSAPSRQLSHLAELHGAQKSITVGENQDMPYQTNGKSRTEYSSVNVNFGAKATLGTMLDDLRTGKSQSYSLGPTGGYILRQEVAAEILPYLRSKLVLHKMGCKIWEMQGATSLTIPKTTSGTTGYWVGEGQTITDSQLALETVTLFPKPVAAMIIVPNIYLQNSFVNYEAVARDDITYQLERAIELAAFYGTGGVSGTNNSGAQPLGLMNDTRITTTTLATNGRAPTFNDLIQCAQRLATANVEESPSWGTVFSPRTMYEFASLTTTTGEPLLRERMMDTEDKKIIGYPYEATTLVNNAQTVGTSTTSSNVFFGDWRYLSLGISNQLEIKIVDQLYANRLQTAIIASTYVDIAVTYKEGFQILAGVN